MSTVMGSPLHRLPTRIRPASPADEAGGLDRLRLHLRLGELNRQRLKPAQGAVDWRASVAEQTQLQLIEGDFVEGARARIADRLEGVPQSADAFMAWFEDLRDTGPGQNDSLFPWLAQEASLEDFRWFLHQEVAGEAGFDDLVALTQVGMPVQAKLELARNYWDEMGRGHARGMHGPMLARLAVELKLEEHADPVIWEALALANLMAALASNRRYAYQSVGALGVIEMTAPGRVALVNDGLKRLGFSPTSRRYFQLHAGLDIQHSADWNREVIRPLVDANPDLARPIAEGALLRLSAGARCFERYRRHFGLSQSDRETARLQ